MLAALVKLKLNLKTRHSRDLICLFNNDVVARSRGAWASRRLMEYAELRTLVLAGPHE